MALIGYAHVSTTEKHLHIQQDALNAAFDDLGRLVSTFLVLQQ